MSVCKDSLSAGVPTDLQQHIKMGRCSGRLHSRRHGEYGHEGSRLGVLAACRPLRHVSRLLRLTCQPAQAGTLASSIMAAGEIDQRCMLNQDDQPAAPIQAHLLPRAEPTAPRSLQQGGAEGRLAASG